jgi:hypothetical protein
MKIRSSDAELLYADGRMDGQTYMTQLIMALRNFANAPKNVATNYFVVVVVVVVGKPEGQSSTGL